MTITIKNARFSYRGIVPPEGDETPIAWSVSMRFRWNDLPLDAWIAVIVGYNAQKLLPSPETIRPLTAREWGDLVMRNFAEWARKHTEDSYADFNRYIPTLPPGEEIRMTPLPMPFVPDVSRWGEADSTPLEDIQRFRDQISHPDVPIQHKVAVVKIADIGYAAIEERMLGLMSDRRVRGIVLHTDSPSGYLPGRETRENAQLRLYALGAALGEPYQPLRPPEPEVVATAAGKRDMGYLKHDRTKQHKRRRR